MEKSVVLLNFGIKLKNLRKANGLSQEQLAERANLHRTYIGMIERAEKNITLLNVEKIANALKIELIDMFKDE